LINAVVATQGSGGFKDVESLQSARSIGCVSGSTSCSFLVANKLSSQKHACESLSECTDKVALGTIQAFVYDQPMLQYNVKQRQNGEGKYSSYSGDQCEVVSGVLLNREDYGLAFESHNSAYPEAFNHLILDWQESSENADASEKWFGQSQIQDNSTAMGNMWATAVVIVIFAGVFAAWAVSSSAQAREDADAALEAGHNDLNKYLEQVEPASVTNADLLDMTTSLIKGQTQMMNTFYMMNRSVRSRATVACCLFCML
jgi:hypothetical protein